MNSDTRPVAYWLIMIFLLLSFIALVIGQTMAVFDYDFTVRLGMQEHIEEITAIGVEINRGFGAGDTIVYIPLILVSVVGLHLRKRWALYTTSAVMGISIYWSATSSFMFLFLGDVPEYRFVPTLDYWLTLAVYIAGGAIGLLYIVFRGERLIISKPQEVN